MPPNIPAPVCYCSPCNICNIMGNETQGQRQTHRLRKNQNSFSVDFSHELATKIIPQHTKLVPVNSKSFNDDSKLEDNPRMSRSRSGVPNQSQQRSEDSNLTQSLSKLNERNDELRKELIRISSELTQKLKKKKFTVKAQIVQSSEKELKKRAGIQKQLENAHRQADMYRRKIEQLKEGENSDKANDKLAKAENKIAVLDIEIEKVMKKITALKKVTANQISGLAREGNVRTVQELKNEAEALRLQLKENNRLSREKEKKLMDQHQYMLALERKVREINGQYVPGEVQQPPKVDQQAWREAEEEMELLKIKHNEYHKKINGLLIVTKKLQLDRMELKAQLSERKKVIQSLRYKRDSLVKQIQDNLYLFATKKEVDVKDQLSQFESDEQGDGPIIEESDERGTFDVDHLKDASLKQKSHEAKSKEEEDTPMEEQQSSSTPVIAQEQKREPKQWKKRLTREIEKGTHMPNEKLFKSGVPETRKEIRIVGMNVWQTKKKQITALQPIYLVDGQMTEGDRSCNNEEDEYRVSYQLEEFDYLKSVLGIFSPEGFLQFLVLQSHFGKISRIGRSQANGSNFAIGVAKEETPLMITGASSLDGLYWRINRLTFEVLFE